MLLPTLTERGDPIPDLLLPFVGHLLATAFAASCLAAKGVAGRAVLFTSREEKNRLLEDRLRLLGQALISAEIDLSRLDHRLLAALERLAPLVCSVEEAVQFDVQRFASEKTLQGFLNRQETAPGEDRKKKIEHFRIASAQGVPFFLMKARSVIAGSPSDSLEAGEADWWEVFGISWEALSSGMVQIGESGVGRPTIEVPLLPASKRKGLFLRLSVRYLEWDHSLGFDSQIGNTLDAMQRGMMSLKSESPGYLTIVNSFNASMEASGETWADWLIALVPRSWLLYKQSVELASKLAGRAAELLEMIPSGSGGLETVGRAFSKIWPTLGSVEKQKEPSRWRSLAAKLKKELPV